MDMHAWCVAAYIVAGHILATIYANVHVRERKAGRVGSYIYIYIYIYIYSFL